MPVVKLTAANCDVRSQAMDQEARAGVSGFAMSAQERVERLAPSFAPLLLAARMAGSVAEEPHSTSSSSQSSSEARNGAVSLSPLPSSGED
jgi:hypothetical protein